MDSTVLRLLKYGEKNEDYLWKAPVMVFFVTFNHIYLYIVSDFDIYTAKCHMLSSDQSNR